MKVILTILIGFICCSSALHDFHLCKTDVHYKSDQNSIQVTVLTFVDDLEEALNQEKPLDYKLLQNAEHPEADSLIAIYFEQHLTFKINGEAKSFYYLGKEESDDITAIYSYLEIEGIDDPTFIEIDNSIMTELFDDQKNIINIKVNNKPKGTHILTKKNHIKAISL